MATVELTRQQVIDLVRQLPPDEKREVLMALASGGAVGRQARRSQAEEELRRMATERGMDWDTMTEDQREKLVDDLVHEDRSCGK